MDSTVTVLAAGSKRATIVTSLRWPPASASLPKALTCVAFDDEGPGVRAHEQEVERLARAAASATRCLAWIFLIWSKR